MGLHERLKLSFSPPGTAAMLERVWDIGSNRLQCAEIDHVLSGGMQDFARSRNVIKRLVTTRR